MSEDQSFSGFMPMINQITISQEMTMINTEGDLVSAHSMTVETRDGQKNVYSVSPIDLMKLYFLIGRVISSE